MRTLLQITWGMYVYSKSWNIKSFVLNIDNVIEDVWILWENSEFKLFIELYGLFLLCIVEFCKHIFSICFVLFCFVLFFCCFSFKMFLSWNHRARSKICSDKKHLHLFRFYRKKYYSLVALISDCLYKFCVCWKYVLEQLSNFIRGAKSYLK